MCMKSVKSKIDVRSMSIDLFCQKLFSKSDPEKLNIPMNFRMKNRDTTLKDVFDIILTIFMYGIMIRHGKGDYINIANITLDDFVDVSRYMNVIGIMPYFKVFRAGDDIPNISDNPRELRDYSYLKYVKNENAIYMISFDFYRRISDLKTCNGLRK